MSTPSFRFRQFTVWHDRCAMKVGTDGVLLGAWVHVPACSLVHVLDIGTGSGLIALMLAQRAALAQVDALDIDAEAVSQASDNFRNSPFADRLSAYHSSVQDWQMVNDKCPNGKCPNGKCPSDKCSNGTCPNGKCYDLIVSNPPFFRESLRNPDAARNAARHTDTLSYADLLSHSVRLLGPEGRLALVLPADSLTDILALADRAGLGLLRLTRVYSKPGKPVRRVLMELTRIHNIPQGLDALGNADTLFIEGESSPRSEQYAALTRDFYL